MRGSVCRGLLLRTWTMERYEEFPSGDRKKRIAVVADQDRADGAEVLVPRRVLDQVVAEVAEPRR